jgi:RimJ/RimL family protein N-acetyltransferase
MSETAASETAGQTTAGEVTAGHESAGRLGRLGLGQVTLRRITTEDWPAVYSWSSLPELCRYRAWGPDTEQQAREFTQAAAQSWSQNPQTRYAYLACVDGEPIGTGEIAVRQALQRQGEVSYALHPERWGRGHGTAIGNELLRIGFTELGLHRIYGTCDPRNQGSAHVLRKIGMTYEGRLRHTMLIRDGWRDSEMFSILEDEWRAREQERAG